MSSHFSRAVPGYPTSGPLTFVSGLGSQASGSGPVETSLDNPLVLKLNKFVRLEATDNHKLEHLTRHSKTFESGQDLVRQGERPEFVYIVLDGWACRYKHLSDGRRQILAYLLPGDVCDTNMFLLERMDHSIGLMCEGRVARVSREDINQTLEYRTAIHRALMWEKAVEQATAREWILNIGRRDAYEKLAHLFCELWARMRAIGRIAGDLSFALPLTQDDLADTTGLSAVHVNRTLQRMRREDLITLRQQRLTIIDPVRLAGLAGFDDSYLHFNRPIADFTHHEVATPQVDQRFTSPRGVVSASPVVWAPSDQLQDSMLTAQTSG